MKIEKYKTHFTKTDFCWVLGAVIIAALSGLSVVSKLESHGTVLFGTLPNESTWGVVLVMFGSIVTIVVFVVFCMIMRVVTLFARGIVDRWFY